MYFKFNTLEGFFKGYRSSDKIGIGESRAIGDIGSVKI